MTSKVSETWQECLTKSMSLLIISESYDELCEVMERPYTKVSKVLQSLKKHQKRKKTEQLGCLLRRFLFMCHSFKEKISSLDNKGTFEEIMSRYISILIEVSFLTRYSDEKQRCEVIMTTLLLYLKHSPEHMVDAVLRVASCFQTDSATFSDIFGKLLSLSKEKMESSLYLKCLLLTKCWTMYLTGAQRRPFLKSAKSLPIEAVSKKKVNRQIVKCGLQKIGDKTTMTKTLLKFFKASIIESLLRILYEDLNDSAVAETHQPNADMAISTNAASDAEPEFAWFEDRKGISSIEKAPLEEEVATGKDPQELLDFVNDVDDDNTVKVLNDSEDNKKILDPVDSVKHLPQEHLSPMKTIKISNVISLSPGKARDFERDVPVCAENDVKIKSPTKKPSKENEHYSKIKDIEMEPAVIELLEDDDEDDGTESESDSNDSVEDDDDDSNEDGAAEKIKKEDGNDKRKIKDDVMKASTNGSSKDEEISGDESETANVSSTENSEDEDVSEIDDAETESPMKETKEDGVETGKSKIKDAETELVVKKQLEDKDTSGDSTNESSTDSSADNVSEIDDAKTESVTKGTKKEYEDGKSKIKHSETKPAVKESLKDKDTSGDESDSQSEYSTDDSVEEIDETEAESATKKTKEEEDEDGNRRIKDAETEPAVKEPSEDKETSDDESDSVNESSTYDSGEGEVNDAETECATKKTKEEDDDGNCKINHAEIQLATKESLEDEDDIDDDTSSESTANDSETDVDVGEVDDVNIESDTKETKEKNDDGDNKIKHAIETAAKESLEDEDDSDASNESTSNDLAKESKNYDSDYAETEPSAKEEDDNKVDVRDPAMNESSEEEDDSDDDTESESTTDDTTKSNDITKTGSAKKKASEELMKDAVNEPLNDDDASDTNHSESESSVNDLVEDYDDSEDDDVEFEAATKQLTGGKNGKLEKAGVTSVMSKPVKDNSKTDHLQTEKNVNQLITDDEDDADVDIETEPVVSKPLKDAFNSTNSPKSDDSNLSICKEVKVELSPVKVGHPVSKSPCYEKGNSTPQHSKSPKRTRLLYEKPPMTRKRLKSLENDNEIIHLRGKTEKISYPTLPDAAVLRRRSLRPRKPSETDEDTESSKKTGVLDVISETKEQATFATGSQKSVKKIKEVKKVLKRTSVRLSDVNNTREARSVSPKNTWSPKRLRTRVINSVDVVRVKSVGRKRLPNKNISANNPVGTSLLEMSREERDHDNFSETTSVNDGDTQKLRGSISADSDSSYRKNSCTTQFNSIGRARSTARRALIYSSSESSSNGSPPRREEDTLPQSAFSTPSRRSSSVTKRDSSRSSTPKKKEKSKFIDNLPRSCKSVYSLRPAKFN